MILKRHQVARRGMKIISKTLVTIKGKPHALNPKAPVGGSHAFLQSKTTT